MVGNFHAVHKHAGAVGDRTEADGNILAAPFTRNKEIGFVPEIAAVFAGLLIGKEIAERSRDRHRDGFGQSDVPAGIHTVAFGVELKAPHAIQADNAACSGSAGVQQRFIFHSVVSPCFNKMNVLLQQFFRECGAIRSVWVGLDTRLGEVFP